MGVRDRLRAVFGPDQLTEERQTYPLTVSEYANYLGHLYPLFGMQQTLKGKSEPIGGNFSALVNGAYKSNGVVFACMLVRQLLFSDARFQFRGIKNGRPGDLFGTQELIPLEKPWPGATTGDLLTRMEQDASLAGNSFEVRRGQWIRRLRPDWVDIILDLDEGDVDAQMVGIRYQPGGPGDKREPEFFLAEQVAHYAPIPDPLASFRGMSWLTPIIREIEADQSMTSHKSSYMDQGATPNMIVKLSTTDQEKFDAQKRRFRDDHEGSANAGKTLFISGGMDATVVGSTLKDVDFKSVQGAGETRIAAAAGVPPVIVGLSEGLQAATYSNYGQARRRFADGTMRPLWRNACGSLARIINVPGGAELWYDDRDISFLKEDLKDAAEIQQMQAITLKTLIDAGCEFETAKAAVLADDFDKLTHTGLFSVQLQPPGTQMPGTSITVGQPASNGNGNGQPAQLAFKAIADAIERNKPEMPKVDIHNHIPEQKPAEVKVDVPVTVEPAAAPNVTVEAAQVTVEPRFEVPAPNVTVESPKVEVAAPNVTLEPRFDVPQAPNPEVQVNVDSPAVTVNVPEQEAPVVNVEVPKRTRHVIRDRKGRVAKIEED